MSLTAAARRPVLADLIARPSARARAFAMDATLVLVAHIAHDAELDHVEDRNFRVRHVGEQAPDLLLHRRGCYHCAPG